MCLVCHHLDVIFEDRARADSFGEDAAQYDRARPSYPPQLFDDLLPDDRCDVVDVGCGTGIVARLLTDRGCSVVGVEPDRRMADVALGHGLTVEISTFEDWDSQRRTFDVFDELPTHSGHRTLPREVLARVLEEVGELIEGLGGQIVVEYVAAGLFGERT